MQPDSRKKHPTKVMMKSNQKMKKNTLGECKYTVQDGDVHSNWMSYVRFSPNNVQPTIVSVSWDKNIQIWNLSDCKLRYSLAGHNGYVNIVIVSLDGHFALAVTNMDSVVGFGRGKEALLFGCFFHYSCSLL
ncbi:hypothetical protein AgCh_011047 [Apium graveolens]